jgi:hypothetical protein
LYGTPRCQALIFNKSIFLPSLSFHILLFGPQRSPSFVPTRAPHGRRAQGRSRMAVAKVVHQYRHSKPGPRLDPTRLDQELLLRNEYLVAENRILKAQLQGRLQLSDAERARLGEIGHRLGREALEEVATTLPDTTLAWYRRLVARKSTDHEDIDPLADRQSTKKSKD